MRFVLSSALVLIVGIVAFAAITVWPIMLLLGAVGSFLAWVPILSFWQTALFVLLISFLGAVVNSSGSVSKR